MRHFFAFKILILIGLYSSLAVAQSAVASSLDWLRLVNIPQCAADSQAPAKSVFLFIDPRIASDLAKNLANQRHLDRRFVDQGVYAFKSRVTELTLAILNGLVSGRLPLLSSDQSEYAKVLRDRKSVV